MSVSSFKSRAVHGLQSQQLRSAEPGGLPLMTSSKEIWPFPHTLSGKRHYPKEYQTTASVNFVDRIHLFRHHFFSEKNGTKTKIEAIH